MKIFSAPSLPVLLLALYLSLRSSSMSLPLPARFHNPHEALRGSFARSRALATSAVFLLLARAHPRAAHHRQLWTTTSSYRFLRHSACCRSCQINNSRRPRRRLPRYRRGGRSGIEIRKPPLAGVAHRAGERERTLDQVAGVATEHQPPGDGDPTGDWILRYEESRKVLTWMRRERVTDEW